MKNITAALQFLLYHNIKSLLSFAVFASGPGCTGSTYSDGSSMIFSNVLFKIFVFAIYSPINILTFPLSYWNVSNKVLKIFHFKKDFTDIFVKISNWRNCWSCWSIDLGRKNRFRYESNVHLSVLAMVRGSHV